MNFARVRCVYITFISDQQCFLEYVNRGVSWEMCVSRNRIVSPCFGKPQPQVYLRGLCRWSQHPSAWWFIVFRPWLAILVRSWFFHMHPQVYYFIFPFHPRTKTGASQERCNLADCRAWAIQVFVSIHCRICLWCGVVGDRRLVAKPSGVGPQTLTRPSRQHHPSCANERHVGTGEFRTRRCKVPAVWPIDYMLSERIYNLYMFYVGIASGSRCNLLL
jgi:hypothetical protein